MNNTFINYQLIIKKDKRKVARCLFLCNECLKKDIKTYITVECPMFKLNDFKNTYHLCHSCNSLKVCDELEQKTGKRSKTKGMSYEQKYGHEKAEQLKRHLSETKKGIKIGHRPIAWISPMKGKTYEELYGQDKALELKQLRKEKNPGMLRKGKTYEEFYGNEKAKRIKQKFKNNNRGKHLKGKAPLLDCGNAYSGYYKQYFFRSFLELSFIINFLEFNNLPIVSAEYIKIPYINSQNKNTFYRPDFIVSNTIYEIKPSYFLSNKDNILKFEAAQKYCIDNGYKYVVMTEKNFKQLQNEQIKNLYLSKMIMLTKNKDQKFKLKFKLEDLI